MLCKLNFVTVEGMSYIPSRVDTIGHRKALIDFSVAEHWGEDQNGQFPVQEELNPRSPAFPTVVRGSLGRGCRAVALRGPRGVGAPGRRCILVYGGLGIDHRVIRNRWLGTNADRSH